MKVLIFGPSGSGKTYVSQKLKTLGVNAIDADTVEGLSSWFDGAGNKVTYQIDADKTFLDNHSFLWDRKFLKNYLNKTQNVYLFGAAGNVFEMLDLFDKVYFLKIDPEIQKERLTHKSRENPMGNTDYQRENAAAWGRELELKAKDLNIPFIEALLSPMKIMSLITN